MCAIVKVRKSAICTLQSFGQLVTFGDSQLSASWGFFGFFFFFTAIYPIPIMCALIKHILSNFLKLETPSLNILIFSQPDLHIHSCLLYSLITPPPTNNLIKLLNLPPSPPKNKFYKCSQFDLTSPLLLS